MQPKINQKTQDIIELMRLSALHPDQIDPMLTQTAQVITSTAKSDMNIEEIVLEAKQKLLSDDFLKEFTSSFDKIFTSDEIKQLITYYKSDAVKKLYKSASETYLPIYAATQEVITQIVKPASLENDIISINHSNFKTEIKEFTGSVLLEAYSAMCEPCQAMTPIFSELNIELGEKIKFCKLDLGIEFQLSKELEISLTPTLLFFKNGKIVDRHIGLINKDDLKKKIANNNL